MKNFDTLSIFEQSQYFTYTRDAIAKIVDGLKENPASGYRYEGLDFTMNGSASSPKLRMVTGHKTPERIAMRTGADNPETREETLDQISTLALQYIADNRELDGYLYEINPNEADAVTRRIEIDDVLRARLFCAEEALA